MLVACGRSLVILRYTPGVPRVVRFCLPFVSDSSEETGFQDRECKIFQHRPGCSAQQSLDFTAGGPLCLAGFSVSVL